MPALAIVRNNSPWPLPLPFPFAGTLGAGEQILTRYTAERARFLLDGGDFGSTPGTIRELVVNTAQRDSATESDISPKSPPRDVFFGAVVTKNANVARILWRVPKGPADALVAAQFQPGAYRATLTVQGAKKGGAAFSAYTRLIDFQVLADGTIDSGTAVGQVLGTDTETNPATNISIGITPAMIIIGVVGIAAEDWLWSATMATSMVIGS